MPRLKTVGSLPSAVTLIAIKPAVIREAAKKAGYKLKGKKFTEIFALCNFQSYTLTAQMIAGTKIEERINNYSAASSLLLEDLPDLKYRPNKSLRVKVERAAFVIPPPSGRLPPAEFVLRDLVLASLHAIFLLLREASSRPTKAELWGSWIRVIGQVLESGGYDTSSSHHTKVNAPESKFVIFIFELEKALTEKFRRLDLPSETLDRLPKSKAIGEGALAKAISRAREGFPRSLKFSEAFLEWKKINPYLATAQYYIEK